MEAKWSIEERVDSSWWLHIFSIAIALFLGVVTTGLLLEVSGSDPWLAMEALYEGAAGSSEEIYASLSRATPIILTGLASVVAFRARLWSIGQEGQLIIGGIGAFVLAQQLSGFSGYIAVGFGILGALMCGGLLGALAGYLKAHFRLNEILSTVMLNYIVFYFLSYLLGGFLMDPNTDYLQSALLPDHLRLTSLVEDSRLHSGFIIGLVIAALVAVLLSNTSLGFSIRSYGLNPTATVFKGIRMPRLVIGVMFCSGAIAGLAGASEVLGSAGRVDMSLASGIGYSGLLVALAGGLNPWGTVFVAILLGGIINGGFFMQVLAGVPMATVDAMQGIIFLTYLICTLTTRYRIKRVVVNV